MAVPGRANGLMSDDENDDGIVIDEEDVEIDPVEDGLPQRLYEVAMATELGDVVTLRHTIDNLFNIDEPIEDGDTALHLACLYGHLPCVQLLLDNGASLEAKDEEGAIPLHDACAGGFTQIVQLLINSASDPAVVKRMLETVDVEGDTPLHHAARGEHADVIRLLLSAGASITKTNIYGKTPSELADPQTEAKRVLEEAANAMR